ncbi:hypothetical protein B0T22DRAFT_252088 [Podospora appendiculata]|uniref:RING-type E3 ubiquitin transferase n=1 Tax=Podospora appendiculata TaxID=314037 RepID=A0AAE0X2E3_9PEZI|nr:hypothetical protein B0T22DRAFT_252088 [Podospora appendiculata]
MASMLFLFLAIALAPAMVSAEKATIRAMSPVPAWQSGQVMSLQITAPDGAAAPVFYSVLPLTANEGLNQTETARKAVNVQGQIISLDSNDPFRRLTESVVYLCCDPSDSNLLINDIMSNETNHPKAIVLYSLNESCCGLQGKDLNYTSLFTMADAREADQALNYTRWDPDPDSISMALISGNDTTAQDSPDNQGGSNSAVAMSILYSITGLITLLFLIIIATGAIRAHRYPERYGPRSGYGGRPRQSRAKGLARAVLETLPIVKFGDPSPGKLDPALELEHQPSRSSHDPATGTRLSAIPEEPQPQPKCPSEALPTLNEGSPAHPKSTATAQETSVGLGSVLGTAAGESHGPNDEHLGCSICTEDFTVGEDVRVLPCDHKFHPPCIDPWLINISGTCPLCRLDLRPQGENTEASTANSDTLPQLAPPLAADFTDHEEASGSGSQQQQRRRSSRLLDLHRLRHASVEERIEILRRHRSQQQASAATQQHQQQQPHAEGAESDERGRRARLTDRLRVKFRIRTRTQSPGQEGSPEEAPRNEEAPSS